MLENQSAEDVYFSSEMTVKLVDCMASDSMVVRAAQVSAKGENNPDTEQSRLINALLKQRHGSPFEHTAFTFYVNVPLFVAREWQRHRMGSFNELSGRYSEMKPKFYQIPNTRSIVNVGTSMKPVYPDMPSLEELRVANEPLRETAYYSWEMYQHLILEAGVAKEVARMHLPLNIYTEFYWTVNARSLMNFLSLRVNSRDSVFRSYPQQEIHEAALQVEEFFAEKMPHTWYAFVQNGRVAP